MSIRPQTIRITPSLLDRLFDDDPLEVTDFQPNFRQGLEQLKQSVARDLEGLLNTRAGSAPDLAFFPELRCSVLTYGLPDFSTLSAANEADRARIRAEISSVIARFEPRLIQIQVHLVAREGEINAFSFHIEALLKIDPVPEPVMFDAVLDVATQLYRIE
ncbi:type VI secretion system baseplate subunit TssE [Chitinibacter sp. S2-10]|uniref:type VI secretion system baseplate subunit TssE n=1 Tax=Chitinibacter sp. S2-10 TaxID=3373597 RepID=UPI0039775364